VDDAVFGDDVGHHHPDRAVEDHLAVDDLDAGEA
jgi:hypothetical protein